MNKLLQKINDHYKSENKIHAVMIELTHACPSDCEHCFLNRSTKDEMSFAEIADLLKQLAAEGTFNLGLTGGEPMARRDFAQILEEAQKYNFFISVLTTAQLIDKPEIELFKRCGVQFVEVSLLGACPDTHDAIMRKPGAFDRTIAAVKLLRAANITVALKTTIMKPNVGELDAMSKLASDLGCEYSANVSVATKDDGDPAPLSLALSEDEVAGVNPVFLNGGQLPDEDFSGGATLVCRAGITVAAISPRGDIYPCILLPKTVGNIRRNTVHEIWHENPDPMLTLMRNLREEDSAGCFSCELKDYCRRCPGIAYMETGVPTKKCPSSCTGAKGIYRAVHNNLESFPASKE